PLPVSSDVARSHPILSEPPRFRGARHPIGTLGVRFVAESALEGPGFKPAVPRLIDGAFGTAPFSPLRHSIVCRDAAVREFLPTFFQAHLQGARWWHWSGSAITPQRHPVNG